MFDRLDLADVARGLLLLDLDILRVVLGAEHSRFLPPRALWHLEVLKPLRRPGFAGNINRVVLMLLVSAPLDDLLHVGRLNVWLNLIYPQLWNDNRLF